MHSMTTYTLGSIRLCLFVMNMEHIKNIPVHILVVLFGTGSWMTLNGVLVESPILTQELPEGWALVTYITVISQLANIGPVLFSVLKHYKKGNEKCVIHGVMLIGITASFIAILVWKKTVFIGKTQHSVPLLVLVFLMALLGCTAVVVFPLFIANFKRSYLISLVLGEGMSGLIPGVMAIIQGTQDTKCQNVTINETLHNVVQVTSEPLFSTTTFFIILFIMMVTSEVSFILLTLLPAAQKERIIDVQKQVGLQFNENSPISPSAQGKLNNTTERSSNSMTTQMIVCLLIQQGLISGLSNTVLPSLQSYACIPYGMFIYHLAATLSSIANPLGTFTSFFLKSGSKSIHILVTLVLIASCYVITMAVFSPTPPMANTNVGKVIMVLSCVIIMGGGAYVKISIANIIRQQGKNNHLFLWGLATQFGAFSGAVITFSLVQFTKVFQAAQPCIDVL